MLYDGLTLKPVFSHERKIKDACKGTVDIPNSAVIFSIFYLIIYDVWLLGWSSSEELELPKDLTWKQTFVILVQYMLAFDG